MAHAISGVVLDYRSGNPLVARSFIDIGQAISLS